MNDYQIMIAMIGGAGYEDPRTRFSLWLLEKGEPLFTYLKVEFGITQGTVIGTPVLLMVLIWTVRRIRERKKTIMGVMKPIIGILFSGFLVVLIIFGQVTQTP